MMQRTEEDGALISSSARPDPCFPAKKQQLSVYSSRAQCASSGFQLPCEEEEEGEEEKGNLIRAASFVAQNGFICNHVLMWLLLTLSLNLMLLTVVPSLTANLAEHRSKLLKFCVACF